MYHLRISASVFLLTLLSISVLAQNEPCPALASLAFEQISEFCEDTRQNQVCYGHGAITLESNPAAPDIQFQTPGDLADLDAIARLQLSPMDEDAGEWGVASMRLQADIPDTLPGQLLSFLLFGDVTVLTENPDATASTEDEENTLQAYYFQSGFGDTRCEEAPNSGLLIQTPEGIGAVHFMLNSVEFELGSVAFLQAIPGDEMRINLLNGFANIRAFGEERQLRGGMRIRIPINDDLTPVGAPSPVEKCATNDLVGVPYEDWDCDEIQVVLDPRYCPGSVDVPEGMNITLHIGSGYESEAEAETALAEAATTISIGGADVSVYHFGVYLAGEYWTYGTNHDWGTPEPGSYSVQGIEPNTTRDCTVNIVAPDE